MLYAHKKKTLQSICIRILKNIDWWIKVVFSLIVYHINDMIWIEDWLNTFSNRLNRLKSEEEPRRLEQREREEREQREKERAAAAERERREKEEKEQRERLEREKEQRERERQKAAAAEMERRLSGSATGSSSIFSAERLLGGSGSYPVGAAMSEPLNLAARHLQLNGDRGADDRERAQVSSCLFLFGVFWFKKDEHHQRLISYCILEEKEQMNSFIFPI